MSAVLVVLLLAPLCLPQDINSYYGGIDSTATNDDLKGQLQDLINPHTVYSYDDVWSAFPTIDIYLPTYPCDSDPANIPDIYSSYCWEPEKIPDSGTGGECGNYKQEGDCFNREVRVVKWKTNLKKDYHIIIYHITIHYTHYTYYTLYTLYTLCTLCTRYTLYTLYRFCYATAGSITRRRYTDAYRPCIRTN